MTLKDLSPRVQDTSPPPSPGPAAHLEELCKNEGPGDSWVGSHGPSPMPETAQVWMGLQAKSREQVSP